MTGEPPGNTPTGSDRISTPSEGTVAGTPTGVTSVATPGGTDAQPHWTVWGRKLKRLLAALGVTSVVSAIALWKSICPMLGLCGTTSFAAVVEAAISEPDAGLRSEKIVGLGALLRDEDNARQALPRLTAFVREKRRRQYGDTCSASTASAPGDVQAAITVMVVAANLTNSPLQLDSLDLTGVSLRGTQVSDLRMSGACLARAVLDSAELRGAHFTGAELPGALFRGAVLDSASFEGARLDSASFRLASLIGADLSESSAVRTDFGFARMQCALLGNGALAQANFTLTDLRWSYFGGAELGSALNLTETDSVRNATFDGAEGMPTAVASQLRARGALLEQVSDLTWYQPRIAQFAADSACDMSKRRREGRRG